MNSSPVGANIRVAEGCALSMFGTVLEGVYSLASGYLAASSPSQQFLDGICSNIAERCRTIVTRKPVTF